jgi:hypothetical protein
MIDDVHTRPRISRGNIGACRTEEPETVDCEGRAAESLRAILSQERFIRGKADRIGELLLIGVVRAGPDGMVCDKFDREDRLPFRIDPPSGDMKGVSWHLTLTYGGPLGDALGSRARWSNSGEAAAECIIDAAGLAEALASGRLIFFFRETADWLESEVRPRGLATQDRIKEGAGIARDLARYPERWHERLQDPGQMTGEDANLRS